MLTLDYCTTCAVEAHGGVKTLVSDAPIYATAWVNGEEYPIETTIKRMAQDADRGPARPVSSGPA
jgi:hypothetical protein